ncbi:MAG: tRNA (adenosine(37)-N6)-threonylcarbamoyltransferase complex ATPase subunit type 1 TsaE [Verrucomicrobiota bacterium]
MQISWTQLEQGLALPDEEATIAAGNWIGAHIQPNRTITLEGDLGDGKTTLAKGIAAGWGVKETVKSPTFHYFLSYTGARGQLIHLDAYRLETPDDYDSLCIEEILTDPWLLIVEWPQNVGAGLLGPTTAFSIKPGPNRGRTLQRI